MLLETQIYEIWDPTINEQNNIGNVHYVQLLFLFPDCPQISPCHQQILSMSTEQFETWTNSQSWNIKKPNRGTKNRETFSLSLRHAFAWDGYAWRLPCALEVVSSRLGAIEDGTKAMRWGGTGRSSHLKPWRKEIESDLQQSWLWSIEEGENNRNPKP